MTKNRIVKYAANTALLAVLAAAGIGVYQIGTYTPDKEIQEELQTDQSEDTVANFSGSFNAKRPLPMISQTMSFLLSM